MGRIDYETETLLAMRQGGFFDGPTHSLRAEGFDASEDGSGRGTPLVAIPILEAGARTGKSTTDIRAGSGIGDDGDPMFTLQRGKQHAVAVGSEPAVAFNWNAQVDQMNFSPSTTPSLTCSQGAAIGPVAFQPGNLSRGAGSSPNQDTFPTLKSDHGRGGSDQFPHVAFSQNQVGEVRESDITNTLNTNSNASGRNSPLVRSSMAVRRLTPVECERLQGFPDGWTNIPWRGKATAPDGPRYKALGNSMAVPCMRWIGERIAMVDAKHGIMDIED